MVRSSVQDLVNAIQESQSMVSLMGAGISIPSGTPDSRGERGLRRTYEPGIHASYRQFSLDPSYFREMHLEIMRTLVDAAPNPAPRILATLEGMHLMEGIITQNVDGLHQKAGSKVIYELHGSNDPCSCITFGKHHSIQEVSTHLFSFETEELISLV